MSRGSARPKGRNLRKRPPQLLGRRWADRRSAAVPGVVRQPAPLCADRAPGRAQQADRCRQERTLSRGHARHLLAHRRAGGSLGLERRRAVSAERSDPHEHTRRAARCGVAARQPVPAGNRVAVLTNSGGPGIMCADACEAEGLELVEPAPATAEALRSFLPAEAGLANPVDMLATASGDDYGRAVRTLAADERVDAIVTIFTPPLVTRSADVARA